jgi:hypothetical protein
VGVRGSWWQSLIYIFSGTDETSSQQALLVPDKENDLTFTESNPQQRTTRTGRLIASDDGAAYVFASNIAQRTHLLA